MKSLVHVKQQFLLNGFGTEPFLSWESQISVLSHTQKKPETVVQHSALSAHHTDFSHHSVSLSSSDTDE